MWSMLRLVFRGGLVVWSVLRLVYRKGLVVWSVLRLVYRKGLVVWSVLRLVYRKTSDGNNGKVVGWIGGVFSSCTSTLPPSLL